MNNTKKLLAFLIAIITVFSLASCGVKNEDEIEPETETTIYERNPKTGVAALNGPTGIGLIKLKTDKSNAYSVTYYSDPQEVVPLIVKGEVDIAALPVNLAANLYKKTDGGIQVLAVNTLGVLHVLEKGDSIKTISDMRGKTVYSTGQGSTPEFTINYILEKNGIDPEKDIDIEYKTAHNELATLAIEGKVDICILPEPFASKVLSKNSDYREALDITAEWDKVSDTKLVQGCVVARKEYIENNPEIITEFLDFNEVSVNFVNKAAAAPNELVEAGMFEDFETAMATIPRCNIVFITGTEMKEAIDNNLKVLFEADPTSVGGEIPDDNFYYIAQ